MKKRRLVGHPFGPDTSAILVGSFRRAATWAAREGLHLSQWTLIESHTPLVVFDRRPDPTLRGAPRPLASVDEVALPTNRGADDVSRLMGSTPRLTSPVGSADNPIAPVEGAQS